MPFVDQIFDRVEHELKSSNRPFRNSRTPNENEINEKQQKFGKSFSTASNKSPEHSERSERKQAKLWETTTFLPYKDQETSYCRNHKKRNRILPQ